HDRDSEQQRQWKRDRGNQRIRGASKEDVNYYYDQNERDHERELHIVNGIDNALGPVEYRNECDRPWKAGADLGEERFDRLRDLDRVCACLSRDGQHYDRTGGIKTTHPKCTGEPLVLHALAN